MRIARLLSVVPLALVTACGSITDPGGGEGPVSLARKPARSARPPVLFVHGWNSSGAIWTTMMDRFRKDGWRSTELASFTYNTAVSNATTAALIAGKVDSILLATGAPNVQIVTHSMGALSARYYVRNLGGDGKVGTLVSLGGPNHGTYSAALCPSTACVEMRVGSSFLSALNATDETWGAPLYATWTSPCDNVISPRTSTALGGAQNFQTSCLQHGQLYQDSRVYAEVRAWVSQPTSAALILARAW